MPRVGFESTISVFQRAKTVHALDRAATVMGPSVTMSVINPTRADLGTDPDSRGG
jgi:hypothetical protein